MRKYTRQILLFLLIFNTKMLVNAQVLENYSTTIEQASTIEVFSSTKKTRVKINLQSFPKSDILIKVPGKSTVFLDSLLWFQVSNDTAFQIPLVALTQILSGKNAENSLLTIINERISNDDVKVLKGVGDLIEILEIKPIKASLYELRKVNTFDDFFYLSLLIPLFLLSLFKIIYPQFLKTIISPLDVFSGEDFSDTNSLAKFFSIHIVFYLLVVNMFLASLIILICKELFSEKFILVVGENLNQYFFYWLLLTILLTFISIFKFIYLKIIAYIFKMEKVSFSHYFYVLRILTIFSLLIIAIIFVSKQNMLFDTVFLLQKVIHVSFWIYVFIILMLLLMIMNKITYKKYHLFAYICMSEVIPFLIISKLIIG